ncbi:hypothetical protein YC2023_108092 [Brassica napus]
MSSTRTEISCGTKGRIHQVLDCSPTNRERELGLDHRETDDLNTRRGIVSGRVALLPRSTEIQPFVAKIRPSPFPITCSSPKR